MNEMMIKVRETVERGWILRMITAVGQKLYDWLSYCQIGLSSPEVQKFMFHSGFGWQDEQMYRSMVHSKDKDMI